MSEPGTRAEPTAAEKALRKELQQTYESLSEITSRLLLANEAAEAALSTHDRVELCERLLEVASRGSAVRRAAVYLADGGGFSLGATLGLDEHEQAAAVAGGTDLAWCADALEAGHALVADEEYVAADVSEWIAETAADQAAAEAEVEAGEVDGAGGEDDVEATEAVSETGEAVEDSAGEEGAAPLFALYLPVRLQDEAVAVLALGERVSGRVYDRESIAFLEHLLGQFAVGLSRGVLIEKHEERLRELDALLRISREITSSLDIESVLRGIVNTVGALVENDRAEIALLRAGRLTLRAVSGLTRPSADQIEIFRLEGPLRYLELEPRRFQICADDFGGEEEPAGGAVFREYFSAQEMRSFMALPLRDDQGLLGFLCVESRRETWEIEPAEGDALDIVAAQTTVAIRNAMLYSQIPLRGVALPMNRMRAGLNALSPGRRRNLGLAVVAALALGVVPIVPNRAGGASTVRPLVLMGARAPSDGVIARVMIRGGQEVRPGQILAVVEDLDLASRLATLRGDADLARRDIAAARKAGDLTAWRSAQIRLAALENSRAFEEERARAALLAAPVGGQVLELDLPQRVGQHLVAGESFCTVAGLDSMAVEFEVAEEKIALVREGQPVAIKVAAYPARTFHGRVVEIGWRGHSGAKGGARYLVRAGVNNPDHALKPGMTGVAKVTVGRSAFLIQVLDPIVRAFALQWL